MRKSRTNRVPNSNNPESSTVSGNFTFGMAFMDCLPVVFFSISIAVLASRFHSVLFLIGAVMVILAGALKVSWKFVLAAAGRDIAFLNRQMRYLMPFGFLVMLLGLIIDRNQWSLSAAVHHLLSFPAILFFVLAAIGVCTMIFCARHLNGHDAKSNWIEQGVNSLTQFFILLGILM